MSKLKKIAALLIVALMAISFTACAKNDGINLKILYEKDDNMINTYTLMAVNPAAPFVDVNGKSVSGVSINFVGAKAFIDWMLSKEGKDLITGFGKEQFGESLFTWLD